MKLVDATQRSAFTLVEVVIALAVIAVVCAGSYIGFNTVNSFAVTARLYSEAQTAAQNEIDLVLAKAPFDIVAAYASGAFDATSGKVPIQLMTSAELDALSPQPLTSPPPTTNQYYPYYRNTSVPGAPLAKRAFIYKDPVSGQVVVVGTLTSEISDAGATMSFVNATALNVRKATVTVAYKFRNTDFALAMGTLRTADQ